MVLEACDEGWAHVLLSHRSKRGRLPAVYRPPDPSNPLSRAGVCVACCHVPYGAPACCHGTTPTQPWLRQEGR